MHGGILRKPPVLGNPLDPTLRTLYQNKVLKLLPSNRFRHIFQSYPVHCSRSNRRCPPITLDPLHLRRLSTPPPRMAEQVEAAKRRAAERAVADHFDPSFRYVGIGSGTTILYVVDAIKASLEKSIASSAADEQQRASLDLSTLIQFVPTGYQSRQVIVKAGLTPIAFDSLPVHVALDVAFDGADEVDDELNCIKGGGACLFQEKLVATKAKKFVCVAGAYTFVLLKGHDEKLLRKGLGVGGRAICYTVSGFDCTLIRPVDYRKNQSRLLTSWPSIPIEVVPIAVHSAVARLRSLGSTDPNVRAGRLDKSGPDQTDQGNFIIDAKFPGPLLTKGDVLVAQKRGEAWAKPENGGIVRDNEGKWEVEALAKEIKSITGVLEVGLFVGENGQEASKRKASSEKATHGLDVGQKPVSCYFGMQDGSVETKESKVPDSSRP